MSNLSGGKAKLSVKKLFSPPGDPGKNKNKRARRHKSPPPEPRTAISEERLVLVRPVRPDEALRRAESLAEPGELPALACLGTSWEIPRRIPRSIGVDPIGGFLSGTRIRFIPQVPQLALLTVSFFGREGSELLK